MISGNSLFYLLKGDVRHVKAGTVPKEPKSLTSMSRSPLGEL